MYKKIKHLGNHFKLMCFGSKKELKLNDNQKYILYQRDRRIKSFDFTEKQSYMNSKEWNLMQKIWLHEAGHRCQMFPIVLFIVFHL